MNSNRCRGTAKCRTFSSPFSCFSFQLCIWDAQKPVALGFVLLRLLRNCVLVLDHDPVDYEQIIPLKEAQESMALTASCRKSRCCSHSALRTRLAGSSSIPAAYAVSTTYRFS